MIYDSKEICNSLKGTYDSFFSEKSDNENEELFNDFDEDDLCDIEFEEKDIENAIKDLEENSTAGPDGLPAIFLKKTKKQYQNPWQYCSERVWMKERFPKFLNWHILPLSTKVDLNNNQKITDLLI